MSPAQLDALADRAWRRRKKMSPDIEKQDDLEKFDTLLRVHTSQPDKIRPLVEPVLKKKVKTWRFSQVIHDSPTEHVVEFSMHLGENADQTELMAAVQNAVEETATNVELI
jgi:phage terminase small subunit